MHQSVLKGGTIAYISRGVVLGGAGGAMPPPPNFGNQLTFLNQGGQITTGTPGFFRPSDGPDIYLSHIHTTCRQNFMLEKAS